MDRTDRAKALAETYTGGRYDDPWAAVENYREYLDYTARNPNASAFSIAKELEQPRGRIRAWKDGDSVPDPMGAIQTAEANDWLDLDWDASSQALNVLVAWIFAGGAITDMYVPRFYVKSDAHLAAARTILGMVTDANARVDRVDQPHGQEVTLTDDSTALGRYLTVLGAPMGTKNADRDDMKLPSYLRTAPEPIREEFARTYVWLRGSPLPDQPYHPVQISERRPHSFVEAIKRLLEDVAPGSVTGGDRPYRLDRNAAVRLHRQPSIVAYDPVPIKNSKK